MSAALIPRGVRLRANAHRCIGEVVIRLAPWWGPQRLWELIYNHGVGIYNHGNTIEILAERRAEEATDEYR